MNQLLSCSAFSHAHIYSFQHPQLHVKLNGRACVRYLRFCRKVRLSHLEIQRNTAGRWEPEVPVHPAHVGVSILQKGRWQVVAEKEFPCDGRIAGEAFNLETSISEMEAVFRAVMAEGPLRVDLDGVETDHIMVACDREHPTWRNHGDCGAGAAGHAVPFGILDGLRAYGEELEKAEDVAVYTQPLLTVEECNPRAPRGMRLRNHLGDIFFESDYLSVGFSLRRPLLKHLGWDAAAAGKAGINRIVTRRLESFLSPASPNGATGPMVRSFSLDCGPGHWTGGVSIKGNQVQYFDLCCAAGVHLNAVFTVEPRRLLMELRQWADRKTPLLESEAWRYVWDLRKGMTSTMAVPTQLAGRAGDVQLPAMIASDASGCLSCQILESSQPVRLQTDSYRLPSVTTSGFVLGRVPRAGEPLVVSRKPATATIEMAVCELKPLSRQPAAKLPAAIRRHWPSVFSCFRSDYGGFSNHAASTNCHVNQHGCIDVAVFTAKPPLGPDPAELGRFTVERALLDGSGYGYHRSLYLDSDPILVSAAGRIHQLRPDKKWLQRIRASLAEATQRILGTIGEEHLAICRELSGNSGSYRWSSNAMDMIGFGHMDAYVNAWSYRALRNSAALLRLCGEGELAKRSSIAADQMPEAFARHLLNPKTGWVAGWRSRDGQLHDAAYVWVNSVACAFGVLRSDLAHTALERLEGLRLEMGIDQTPFGVPCNLWPIPQADQPLRVTEGAASSQRELFCNGSIFPGIMQYYIRALATHGLEAQASQIARDMEKAYEADAFSPGTSEGAEFFSWDGLACGYEGTFGPNFGSLYAIAIERGIFSPPEPEWWPAIE